MSDSQTLLEQLRRDGCVRDAHAALTPLSGGVSSDIFLVQDGAARFVVKRALAKLRVQDDWFANVGRNATERAYLEWVSRFLPDAVPRLLAANADAGYFCMEFFGLDFANWKQLLFGGVCQPEHAAQAGKILGAIHRRTAGDAAVARRFATTEDFRQLRLEPYLLTTGARHADLREHFEREAGRLAATREALVHGDFSPKNILIATSRMVLLDCEVAWYGDPAFDVAFLLNHFFLKALHHAPVDHGLKKMAASFWRAYGAARKNGEARVIEQRLVPLLLMLLLARVDGKSPVEYLTEPKRQFIRDFVGYYLPSPPDDLAGLSEVWFAQIFNSVHTFPPK
jgi:5-methylthioribose kinase